MIPYIRPPAIDLGFARIEPFGIATALAVLVATYLIILATRRDGKDSRLVQDLVLVGLLGGVVSGHLMHVLLYHPEELHRSALQLFKVWDGLSSTGGMLGGGLAVFLFFRWKGVKLREYTDAITLGMVPAWGVARIGCFLVHDHPGRVTHSFLAVDFPWNVYPGGPRYDLGMMDAIVLFTLAAVLWTLRRKEVLRGAYLQLAMLCYGAIRFFEDFLRATDLSYVDKRYFGLTPAQYVSIGFVIYGATFLILRARRRTSPQPAPELAPATATVTAEKPRQPLAP